MFSGSRLSDAKASPPMPISRSVRRRRQRLDRRIGDLSYPIYICHMLILLPVSMAYDHLKGVTDYRGIDETLMVISLTLIASVWLNRHVGDRIETLHCDASGIWVCAKLLEKGTFRWPSSEDGTVSMTYEELPKYTEIINKACPEYRQETKMIEVNS